MTTKNKDIADGICLAFVTGIRHAAWLIEHNGWNDASELVNRKQCVETLAGFLRIKANDAEQGKMAEYQKRRGQL